MLDLEDSMSPTPYNIRKAHENIRGVVRGDLEFQTAEKTYSLNKMIHPTFMVRVRGLHMSDHATIYDVCEFLEHNGKQLYDEGRGPYLYIPKLETYEEAVFIDTLLKECEEHIGLATHTKRQSRMDSSNHFGSKHLNLDVAERRCNIFASASQDVASTRKDRVDKAR